MKFVNIRRPRGTRAAARRHALALVTLLALGAWLLGCGEDNPTDLGSSTRTPPDTLRSVVINGTRTDSVFYIAATLGHSPTAQIGQQFVYTANVLVAFKVPAFKLEVVNGVVDTLRAQDFRLSFQTDSLSAQPFTGGMRLALLEVAPTDRGWTRAAMIDSPIVAMPTLEPDALAPDTLVAGIDLANHVGRFAFVLQENRIAGWDTIATPGDSVEVNAAIQFSGFTGGGRGFLEFPFADLRGNARIQLNGFDAGRSTAVVTGVPFRVRDVVVFDPNYNPGTNVVASDGHRLHTYLQFPDVRTAVPESAIIHLAELILTQTDTTAGTSFGTSQQIGVVIPTDTTKIYTDSTAARGLAFSSPLVSPVPGTEVAITITLYVFDQQEGRVPNRGMILRLSNEGTKARHFEFYGTGAANPAVRPRLRIIYGMPARFEGGNR